MNDLLHVGHRERLRKRFEIDLGNSMPDYEILELLLMQFIVRKDVKPIAKELIRRFGNVTAVFHADITELMKVKGIGYNTAINLKVIQRCTAIITSSSANSCAEFMG